MSKNITIQEGGVGKQLTADKLKTNLVGGGTCLWIPEEIATLGTKTITADGTYKASADGYYGFSEVTVTGIGVATGVGQDGETHSISRDPSTGNLTDKILPARIAVTTLPTKTTYTDGETIDYTGMVVKAYLNSGELWSDSQHTGGVLQHSELILIDKAEIDPETDGEYTDNNGINALKIQYTAYDGSYLYNNVLGEYLGYSATLGGTGPASLMLTRYNNGLFAARISGDDKFWLYSTRGDSGRWVMSGSSTYRTTINVFTDAAWDDRITLVPTSTTNPQGKGIDNLTPVGTKIPVKWTRMDGTVLETWFTVNVTNSSTPSGGGSGGSTLTVPEGVSVNDIESAISEAMNNGSETVTIAGQEYTIAQAETMRDMLLYGDGSGT